MLRWIDLVGLFYGLYVIGKKGRINSDINFVISIKCVVVLN